jgi:hypothetical protein
MKPWLNYVKILAELELMKERFAKLLLGEDMSGSGKGVSTAVTISNAITNLYGNIFCNELRRLMGKEINMLFFLHIF